mmetsp:Transcript_99222/g.285460  ORF Transcript_99222/g.285460 Transcript_99222/m.285460 type:complete len:519 (+) Transcript_99222:54-1610(+)
MDALRTLHRKPDVLKVIVAAGIVSASMTGTGLVVPVIANQFWGARMAEIGSMMGIARSVVQILFTPAFGRWSDRVPRKWAFVLMGISSWLPMWPFLILGGSEATLWLSASLSVVAGAFASTAIGYALITDLTEVEERTGIFAVGAALMTLVGVLPKTLVAVVHIAMPRHLYAPCWCDFAMMILFLICAASIGSTSSKPTSEDTLEKSAFDDSGAGSDHPAEGAVALDNESFDDLEQASAEPSEDSENSPGTTFRDEPVDACDLVRQTTLASTRRATHRIATVAPLAVHAALDQGTIMDTIRLVCQSASLRNLCIMFTLISLPEVSEVEVGSQFVFQAFKVSTPTETERLSFVGQYSAMAGGLVLCLLVGILGKKLGLVPTIRLLVPLCSAAQLLPLLFLIVPTLWCVSLVSMLSGFAGIISIPMNTLVSLVAPVDRMGEALCAVSMCHAISTLFGNVAVAPVIRLVGTSRFWVFFVAGASSALLSLPFAFLLKEPKLHVQLDGDKDKCQHDNQEDSNA